MKKILYISLSALFFIFLYLSTPTEEYYFYYNRENIEEIRDFTGDVALAFDYNYMKSDTRRFVIKLTQYFVPFDSRYNRFQSGQITFLLILKQNKLTRRYKAELIEIDNKRPYKIGDYTISYSCNELFDDFIKQFSINHDN